MESVSRNMEDQTVLDAGAGNKPFKDLFKNSHYESCDHPMVNPGKSTDHTFLCDLIKIPRPNSYYDTIVCNQVLEHVPEPGQVLKEFCRVLKPGGSLILTVPQCYGLHMIPYNYFNFLEPGVRYLCKQAGFSVMKIEPLGGIFSLMGKCLDQAFWVSLERAALPKKIKAIAFNSYNLFVTPLRLLWVGLDTLDHEKKWTLNYGVFAKKP